jgi:hypothetical protein
VVENQVVPITLRSFETVGQQNLRFAVDRAYRAARQNGMSFHLTYIEPQHIIKARQPFDLEYRQRLYDYGYQRAISGSAWRASIPGAAG